MAKVLSPTYYLASSHLKLALYLSYPLSLTLRQGSISRDPRLTGTHHSLQERGMHMCLCKACT
jgi:hypothetical protein